MTVIQAGSMGKAADRLNMFQPTISKSIADLELTLGVPLLDRKPRGVEPTEYGRALLNCGVAVFDELRRGVNNIEFLADPTVGNVRIGCSPYFTGTFVSAVVDRLSRRYPSIVIDVVAMEADTMHRELSERNVDFLIARPLGPLAEDQSEFEMLYDDEFVVVAGAKNPWARRRKVELAELVNEPWTLPRPGIANGSVFAEVFRASGLDYPRTTVFARHMELRAHLLATGRFLTIFSKSVLSFPTRRQELKALPIVLPLSRVPLGIITLKNRTLSPLMQIFIDCARQVAKPLGKQSR